MMQKRPLSELIMFIVHHTVTPSDYTVQDVRVMHQARGYADIGYHWLVGERGPKQGRPIKYAGAHAAGEKWNKAREGQGLPFGDLNSVAVGIALIGRFDVDAPSPKLIAYTADTIKRLSERLNVPITRATVKPHYAVDWTACPGKRTMQLLYERLAI